jgi:glycerate kinase
MRRGGSTLRTVKTLDALGRDIQAPYLMTGPTSAIVVAADILGLDGLASHDLDPLAATSRGLAVPILAAIAEGASHITVFLGGVASIDGGLGLLSALGAVVHDADGVQLRGSGRDLTHMSRIDVTPAIARFGGIELVVASDVDSPLHGPNGAAHLFGPQKGAGPDEIKLLDQGLSRLTRLLGPSSARPGAGAAGGIGAALLSLGATRTSGADAVLELTNFAEEIRGAQLCITAEGKVDQGTTAGKAVAAVVRACREAGVPCVVLAGTLTKDAENLYSEGPAGIFAIGRKPRSLAHALLETADDLERTTRAICELAAALERRPSPTEA